MLIAALLISLSAHAISLSRTALMQRMATARQFTITLRNSTDDRSGRDHVHRMPATTDSVAGIYDVERGQLTIYFNYASRLSSACVFADELMENGVAARPFTGESARIVTDTVFGSAAVTDMDPGPLTEALEKGIVPVVTGFQGRTPDRFTTTLGRGGSDTSAVLIGGYLKADAVDIYTDVPGVAKADPRIVPEAAFMDTISQRDMLILAQWGSGVIHPKAVQAAMDFRVPLLRVRSTFDDLPGTAIGTEETPGLAGIAVLKDLSKAPEEGRTFVQSLPEGGAVITVVYHGDAEKVLAAAAGRSVSREGDTVHIGVSREEVQETAVKLYAELIKGV
jgi:aspartate kinase